MNERRREEIIFRNSTCNCELHIWKSLGAKPHIWVRLGPYYTCLILMPEVYSPRHKIAGFPATY
jgi:hypothetical protein